MKYFIGAILAVLGAILLVLIFSVTSVMGVLNRDASLRAAIEAAKQGREASYDTMYNIIMQKAQLPKAAKEDLLALLPAIAEGRAGGSLFKSVQERYPEFTMPLYLDLSRSIEVERKEFLANQQRLFDLSREHNALLGRPFAGLVLSLTGRGDPVEVRVISSEEAKEAAKSGLDRRSLDLNLNSEKEWSN